MHFNLFSQPTAATTKADPSKYADTKNNSMSALGLLRTGFIDVPMMIVLSLLVGMLIIQDCYNGYIMKMMDSYRRGDMDRFGFYEIFDNDFTYYNRQCDVEDIMTTRDANDLLIDESVSKEEATDIMMKHGAVVFKNVLKNDTAAILREYLETRNQIQEQLPWDEKFFEEEGRLSLGLGVEDHPVIKDALKQVGEHKVIKRTLEGILGPNPAVVEISTLTTMYGAGDQGIHTDSDYFGSSLLYSRNFLHSYTMFMALQDTTAKMGATTLCPGSQLCANEDLEEMCLDNGAFEASSNGYTGREAGVLLRGDAMMFNQNVWHRGPSNNDPKHPDTNRVMFIITFVTNHNRYNTNPKQNNKRKTSKYYNNNDVRYQGLGTYYYQRWNMWGHTYEDLNDPELYMLLPFRLFRSLGLWKPKGSNFGVTWIENFARELATRDNFYANYELPYFVDYLVNKGIPTFLLGDYAKTLKKKDCDWELFIEQTMSNVISFLKQIYLYSIGIYTALGIIILLIMYLSSSRGSSTVNDEKGQEQQKQRKKQLIPSFIKRLILTHGSICTIGYIMLHMISQTELAQYANSGRIFETPFPALPEINGEVDIDTSTSTIGTDSLRQQLLGPTVFPERNDILIGTRFDADYLASFNNMLDYHPGNVRFHNIIKQFVVPSSNTNANLVLSNTLIDNISRSIINNFLKQNEKFDNYYHKRSTLQLAPRFLLQDPLDGHWTIMNIEKDIIQYISRTIKSKENPIVGGLYKHLRAELADSRFGLHRNTILSRKFMPLIIKDWESIVFSTNANSYHKNNNEDIPAIWKNKIGASHNDKNNVFRSRKRLSIIQKQKHHDTSKTTSATRATTIVAIALSSRSSTSAFNNDGNNYLYIGDRVLVNFQGKGKYFEAKILKMYSEEECLVKYTNTAEYDKVNIRFIRKYEPFVEGDTIEREFKKRINNSFDRRRGPGASDGDAEKRFFKKGIISNVHPRGLYDVTYLDDTYESFVEPKYIRKYTEEQDEDHLILYVDDPSNNLDGFAEGEAVFADYLGNGEWFPGIITHVDADNGTYSVYYDDGDKEVDIEPERLRYM